MSGNERNIRNETDCGADFIYNSNNDRININTTFNSTLGDMDINFTNAAVDARILLASGIYMVFVWTTSVIVCFAVISALWRTKQLDNPTQRLVGWLIVVEIGIRFMGSPFVTISIFSGRWVWGERGCQYYGFTMTWLGMSSIFIFPCIAVVRYIVVCRPLYKVYLTKFVCDVIAVTCLLHGAFWAALPLIPGVSEYVVELAGIACSPRWYPRDHFYNYGLLIIGFPFPITIAAVSYYKIFKQVRRRSASRNRSLSDSIAQLSLATMAVFVLCWTPYTLISIYHALGLDCYWEVPRNLTILPLLCAKSAGICTTLVFSVKNQAVRRMLYCRTIFLHNHDTRL